ncbi:50S ribosomal protein L11 methyltransferase [candidate division KSB1 bacterium]|nr:50S ribosomal protein L11 methyltransferase [candidate division KSB1 bacterium]
MKPPPQAWQVLSFHPGLGLDEMLAALLFDLGAVGTQQMEDHLLVYFPEPCESTKIANDLQTFLAQLRAGGMNLPEIAATHRQIEAQDWHSAWRRYFKPIFISERVLIRPSWEAAVALAPGQIEIIIDPKQAFGTGHHATTRGIVQLLEKYLRPGMRVIDVGTGTGILAIAAAKLQPGVQVVALDTDSVAVEAAYENINLNRAQECVKLYTGPLAALRVQTVDLILANLQHQTLLPLLADFSSRLSRGGVLLLSGLLVQESESICLALESSDLQCIETRTEEEWLTLAAAVAQTAGLPSP